MHGISPFVTKETRPSMLPDEPPRAPSTTGPAASSGNAAPTNPPASRFETTVADQDAVQEDDKGATRSSIPIRRMVLSKTSKYNPAIHTKLEELSRLLNHTKPEQKAGLLRKAKLLQQPQLDKDESLHTGHQRAVPAKIAQSNAVADPAVHLPKLSRHNEPARKKVLFRKIPFPPPSELETNIKIPAQHSDVDVTSVDHDRPTHESDWEPRLQSLQQQLRELAEQVRSLKDAFDTIPVKPEPSQMSPSEAAIPESKSDVSRSLLPQAETGQLLTPSSPASVAETAQRAHELYCSSTTALANIVKSLETAPFLTEVQIGQRVRKRLAKIARQAAKEDDRSMREALLATSLFEENTSRAAKRNAIRMIPSIRQVNLQTSKDRGRSSSEQAMSAKTEETSAATESRITDGALASAKAIESNETGTPNRAGTGRAEADSDPGNEGKPEPKPSDARSVSTPSPASSDGLERRPSDVNGLSHQTSAAMASDATEQSLLEELFPETNAPVPVEPVAESEQYPKLSPPSSDRIIRPEPVASPKDPKQQIVDSFLKSGENITVLQLEHCSVELTEPDFRRVIPKGKHIEAWNRDGAYYKVIPGRNPISLERLPFYYILFKSAESAYAYQNNVARLHKLAALHQPTNIFSAVPPPKGFLEDGEDIEAITSSYLLRPTEHAPAIRTLMQPYHPGLRSLFEQGGYTPIVPDVDDKRNRIYKILLHIEGYEPNFSDLFTMFRHDAAYRGVPLPLRNESMTSLHRLRDLVNLKTHVLPLATTNPRAYDTARSTGTKIGYDDPSIAHFMKNDDPVDEDIAKEISQIIMNQVYNRWILDFDDEDEARRFAIAWHRRPLPDLSKVGRTWKDYEEARTCNTELLW